MSDYDYPFQSVVGPAGPANVGTPAAVTPAFGTAYQATDPTKVAFISAAIQTVYSITIAGTQTDEVELRIGPVQATVANGTAGVAQAGFRSSLTGIALTIGLGNTQRSQVCALLPVGWYYAFRRVAGTAATIVDARDQALG